MSEPALHRRSTGLICLTLALVTFGLYLPTLRHGFLDYDDQQYVTENPHVRAGFSAEGLIWAFGKHASNWHPLTWLSHMLDCQLYGLKPLGHHLTSVLVHIATTLLLFLLLQRITGATWRSACVAALFGWHPLHVESVAWVAERKDVLSAFFWIVTLAAYVAYARTKTVGEIQGAKKAKQKTKGALISVSAAWYSLALLAYALGLMAKPMVVTLPFVLLLLDYWPLQRFAVWSSQKAAQEAEKVALPLGRLVLEKIPFLAMSAIVCVLTVLAQRQAFSVVSTVGLPVPERLGHAILAYGHYLGAAFIPGNLAVYYPYERSIPAARFVLSSVVLIGITVLAACWVKRRPCFIVGWLWYLGTLVPVIGLVQVGDQAWADRYTYLPLIGIFLMVVWWTSELAVTLDAANPGQRVRRSLQVTATGIAVALLFLTSRQLGHWRDTKSLFEHAERVTHRNHMAITLLGSLLAKEGNLDGAIQRYRSALDYQRGYAEAHFFLGNAFDQQGKIPEAIEEYQQALGFKPMQEQTHIFLGIALGKQQQFEAAAEQYRAALRINPESAVAHQNLARVLQTQGRLDEAIEHYSTALRLDPGLAQAHNNLGVLLLQKGRTAEGATQLRKALRLNPANLETRYNLALALNKQQHWSEAEEEFGQTVKAASADPHAHFQFGVALTHVGKTREAMSQFASALLLKDDFPEALEALAWILATASKQEFRNGAQAVEMATRACELTTRNDPEKLKTLAAAYAEAGRFPEARAEVERAQLLASSAGRKELAAHCQLMQAEFVKAKPWREK